MQSQTIEFRDVPGFPGYRAGSDGSIWSAWRGPSITDQWKRLTPEIHRRRTKARTYHAIKIYKNGKRTTRLWHRVILESFVGPKPDGCQCRHLDGDPTNNAISNICWGTHKENCQDSRDHGRYEAILTEPQVIQIREKWATGLYEQKELAAEYGVSRTAINSVVNRYSWKHIA